jgi:hypothetical protein
MTRSSKAAEVNLCRSECGLMRHRLGVRNDRAGGPVTVGFALFIQRC